MAAVPENPRNVPHVSVSAAALLALLGAAGLLWLVTNVEPRSWPTAPATAVSVAGEHYRLGPSELDWLRGFSELHFAAGEETAREIVAVEIGARLDHVFARARERLPEFADWYYSLRGEYSRLAMAALSAADLAQPRYVADRAAAMLFPEGAWEADFEVLQRLAETRLVAHDGRVRAAWLAEVTRRLSAQRVPAPLPEAAAPSAPIELERLLATFAERERAAFRDRLSLSTLAATGAAAGPAVWRAAAARRAAVAGRAGSRVAARAAGRGAARVGSAAAGGAVVCAPSGPGAVACALLAGTAAWLGTDRLLLRLEEHLQRDELEEALEWSLTELRAQIERTLLDAYDGFIAAQYAAVRDDIEDGFVPRRADEGRAEP